MPFYEDLSDYVYHRSYFACAGTKNVGWLAAEREFTKDKPAEEILDRLWAFCKVSVAQMRGAHECEFCRNGNTYNAERNGDTLLLGTSEIRVFGTGGRIYAAPTLVYHYVKDHWYKPPEEFLRALHQEPAPPNSDYFDRLQEVGLAWARTSPAATRRFLFSCLDAPNSSNAKGQNPE